MAYPQTFLGLQDAVLTKLRMADNEANRDSTKDWINQAYAQAVEETQALQEAGFASLSAGASTYTLPSRIIHIKRMIARGPTETSFGVPLENVSLDRMLQWRQGNGGQNPVSGTVTAYALIGLNQLEFYPTPTAADVVQFYYTYLPDPLVEDTDQPLLPEPWGSKVLEYGALAQAAEVRADPLGPMWQASYESFKARLQVLMNRRGGVTDQFPIDQGGLPLAHDRSTVTC